MSWFRNEWDDVRVVWLLLAAIVLALVIVAIATWIRDGRACSDTVPAYDGRCWGDRKLVVEGGVAICRCLPADSH